jgi:hypothetical protein
VSLALLIQHTKRIRRIIFPSVACLAVPNFFTDLINGTVVEKKVTEHKMRVLISSTTFARNMSHSEKNKAI